MASPASKPSGSDSKAAEATTSSKASTSKSSMPSIENVQDDDEDLDETLSERLWGLTEMLPQGVRSGIHLVADNSVSGIKLLYGLTRSTTWIVCSTATLLVAPVVLEMERSNAEEFTKHQQRQILLGPNAAMSSGMGMPMPSPIPQR